MSNGATDDNPGVRAGAKNPFWTLDMDQWELCRVWDWLAYQCGLFAMPSNPKDCVKNPLTHGEAGDGAFVPGPKTVIKNDRTMNAGHFYNRFCLIKDFLRQEMKAMKKSIGLRKPRTEPTTFNFSVEKKPDRIDMPASPKQPRKNTLLSDPGRLLFVTHPHDRENDNKLVSHDPVDRLAQC